MNSRNRVFAFAVAFLMLTAPLAIVTMSDSQEEVEATPGFVAGFVAGGITGAILGYWVGSHVGNHANDGVEEQSRRGETNAVISGLGAGTAAIANALENYSQMWLLTEEHWIRQAELASTANWALDKSYEPYSVMMDSGVYYNATYMIGNASVQFGAQFDSTSNRITDWGNYDEYSNGKLKLEMSVGNSTISADSRDDLKVGLGTVVRNVSTGHDAVFYAGGPIWTSQACTIQSMSGHSITLRSGWNSNLPSMEDFQFADQYYLTPGVSFLGYFDQVIGARSAPLEAGIVATSGTDVLLITTDGNSISTGSQTGIPMKDSEGNYNAIQVRVVSSDSYELSCDMTSLLANYSQLLDSIRGVQGGANQSARVIWNIYNDLGESCAYLTTLSLPNTYTGVQWTDEQLQMVTYLVMEQMADYWDRFGNIKTTDYLMTKDSLTLYCRGSIDLMDPSTGKTFNLADGVAFTPIFYRDTTISNGSNTTSDYCFIVVWGKCASLGGFDVASMRDAQIIYAPVRSVMNISEMYYDGAPATTVELDCSDVEWIDPEKVVNPGPVPVVETSDLYELVRLILILAGAGMILHGFSRGSWIWLGIGLILVVAGFLAADAIADLIERFTGPLNWPW